MARIVGHQGKLAPWPLWPLDTGVGEVDRVGVGVVLPEGRVVGVVPGERPGLEETAGTGGRGGGSMGG